MGKHYLFLFFVLVSIRFAQGENVRPPNDDLANAVVLINSEDDSTHVTGTTWNATREPGEPDVANNAGSIWYRWTPRHSGAIRYAMGSPRVAVFLANGDSFADLTLVANTNQRPYVFRDKSYALAVYALHPPGSAVDFRIETAINPPANDQFANAAVLQMTNGVIHASGTTFGATREPDEPLNTNGLTSVWFRWTPERSETVQFAANGGNHVLSLYHQEGTSVSELTLVANEFEAAPVLAGETYYVGVYSRTNWEGPFELTAAIPPPPRHDRFDDALNMAFFGPIAFETGLSTAASSLEPGEPRPGGTIGSVWLRFTAPFSGRLHMQESAVAAASLYTGSSVAELIRLDPPEVIAGASYYVCFNTRGKIGGPFTANLEIYTATGPVSAIANDHFANAILLTNQANALVHPSGLGTRERGEPSPVVPFRESIYFTNTLWWKFVAPADGTLLTYGESICYVIHAGNSLSLLDTVNFGSDLESRQTEVRKGLTYHIQAQPMSGAAAAMNINFYDKAALAEAPPNDGFQNPTPMEGANWSAAGDLRLATSEPGELLPAFSLRRTVWYKWVAPSRGVVRAGTKFGGIAYSYRGSSLANLQQIQPPFAAEPGETFYFQVDVRPGGQDKFSLFVSTESLKPSNDDLADAAELHFARPRTVMHEATLEIGEPAHLSVPHKSAWWRWRVPDVGGILSVRIVVINPPISASTVAIYRRPTFGESLELLGKGENPSVVLEPNAEIFIAVAVDATAQTEVQIRPVFTPGPDARLAQAVQFPLLPDMQATAEPFVLPGTSTSGLPLEFNVLSGPATVSSNLLHFAGSGRVEIRASQAGNAQFLPAESVTRSFIVVKRSQTISFEPVDASAEPIRLTAAASSGLPVVFEVESGPAVVEGNTVFSLGEGPVAVRASQPGNHVYEPAPPVTQLFVPRKFPQSISVDAVEHQPANAGASPSPGRLASLSAPANGRRIELHAQASSGLPTRLAVVSGRGVVEGNQIFITGHEEIVVRATQEGDRLFQPAFQDLHFAGTPRDPVLSIAVLGEKIVLSWPAEHSALSVEAAAFVNGPWEKLPITPATVDQQASIQLEIAGAARFFRLWSE